jgi:threonine aldolase
MPGIEGLDPARVRTNFVLFRVRPSGRLTASETRTAFLDELAGHGIHMLPYAHGQIRAVTHYGVERPDIERTLEGVKRSLAALGPGPSAA